MGITYTGEGLNILISCDFVPSHDWMCFVCWYSISKNLPDSRVVVGCNRKIMNYPIMNWVKRCGLDFLLHKDMTSSEEQDYAVSKLSLVGPLLTVYPANVCVRHFDESPFDRSALANSKKGFLSDFDGLCSDCKSQNPTVFVNYDQGWGKFVPSAWINTLNIPLITGTTFTSFEMTANEMRLARLWESSARLYQSIPRG
jgi:hypothetical protein